MQPTKDYTSFISDLKKRIHTAQYEAMKAVNKEHIQLCWDIGKGLFEKQQTLNWGKSVIEQVADDIQLAFPGIRGFSARNLWLMKQFYETYQENEFLQPMVAEISWSHNVVVFQKCKADLERQFYIKMTKQFGWTKNVLIHQIDNKTYEKHLLNQTNFDQTLPDKYRHQAILAVKDEYQFDFLELSDKHAERELENEIIHNIRPFLMEMGGYFSFIGNQYRIVVEEQEYFIDLLLFHRRLKCLVAIELKIGEFIPEMAGKMQFYLSILNDKVREPDENPSIGIIICRSKSRTIVEYALKDSSQPIGVATYNIQTKLPEKWKDLLPSPEQIKKHFGFLK